MSRWLLVTGGAKRLGRLIALTAAGAGWDLALHCHASAEAAEATAEEVRALGRRAVVVRADLAEPAQVETLLPQAASAAGQAIQGLVNSASLFEWDDAASLTAPGFLTHQTVNTLAPVLLIRALHQGLAAEGTDQRGAVVNILDFKLANPNPDHLSYTLSKYALAGASRVLARALAPSVRVNTVSPGYVLPAPGQDEAEFQRLSRRNPLDRAPDAQQVADAVVFLLNHDTITDQDIAVDCGLHFLSLARDIGIA
ncbi:SDR family oxidoreductase [Nitrospirillum sp. BR 11828]|uniref:SDR family oxidoreductase n=1 Tax=Nitrospirillum sp. BR 11828 TaxID=3104325 RepID=UPI002ACA998E|nr:SDR family oxidoreductase [Nitrospirillum sp. BR 11828]MDZ5648536.1 SDR family oxidoreductase [Nitrospirillum sp. BR 11828]